MKKIEQLKWFYGSLAGICAAFFLTLLSSSQGINQSHYLFIASVLFGILLPVFSIFTIVQIFFIEECISESVVTTSLEKPWVRNLTSISLLAFYTGFIMIICHISTLIAVLFLLTSIVMWLLARNFISEARAEHNKNIKERPTG